MPAGWAALGSPLDVVWDMIWVKVPRRPIRLDTSQLQEWTARQVVFKKRERKAGWTKGHHGTNMTHSSGHLNQRELGSRMGGDAVGKVRGPCPVWKGQLPFSSSQLYHGEGGSEAPIIFIFPEKSYI